MPYVKFSEVGLYTMSEAAERLGLSATKFWHLVRNKTALPEPMTRRGGRFFYDAAEFRTLQTLVNKMRKEGGL